jgi:hypothetical protein
VVETDDASAGDAAPDEYYYAGNDRIALKRASGLVAVDVTSLAPALARQVEGVAKKGGAPGRRGIVIVRRDALPSGARTQLESRRRALMPVVQDDDGSLIVVLPEVRVENDDDTATSRVLRWLRLRKDVEFDVEPDRIVVRPLSHDGRDALHLANEIQEELKPSLSQARFMRVVRRPGVRGPSGRKPPGRVP